MTVSDFLESLKIRFPSASQVLALIGQTYRATEASPTEPFFEPRVLLGIEGEKRHLIGVGAPELNAWARHTAYSSRFRMKAFESGILQALVAENLISAMVLLRSHMEAAGLAAMCEQAIVSAAKSDDFSTLEPLMRRTLFGTALFRLGSQEETVQELLTWAEQEPSTAKAAVKALDSFLPGEHAKPSRLVLYALLCEFAHPNMRGSRLFCRVLREESEGWLLRYEEPSSLTPVDVQKPLESLFDSMRIGHAASELLLLGRFEEGHDGPVFHAPSLEDGQRIWHEILQLPFE